MHALKITKTTIKIDHIILKPLREKKIETEKTWKKNKEGRKDEKMHAKNNKFNGYNWRHLSIGVLCVFL